MTATAAPSDLKPERIDTYKIWQAEQKIPVVRGFFVKDVNTVELEHWDLKGVPCSMVVLDGTGGTNDALRVRDSRRRQNQAAETYVRRDGLRDQRLRRDHGVAARRQEAYLRVGTGQHVRDAAQRRLPALQRQWQRSGALLRGDQLLLYNEPVSQSPITSSTATTLSRPLRSAHRRLLQRPGTN